MTDAELVRMLVNDDALSDDLVDFYLQLAAGEAELAE